MPPERKIQMMLLVLGAKCGRPSGGVQVGASSARPTPSRRSIAPSASPVNPRPTSARKVRRWIRPQGGPFFVRGRRPLMVRLPFGAGAIRDRKEDHDPQMTQRDADQEL